MTRLQSQLVSILSAARAGTLRGLPAAGDVTTKFDGLVERCVRQYPWRNITEFDYGRSYRYSIAAHGGPGALEADNKKIRSIVDATGKVALTHLAISAFSPFATISFQRWENTTKGIVESVSDQPTTREEAAILMKLRQELASASIAVLPKETVDTPVAGIATELADEDHATVGDVILWG